MSAQVQRSLLLPITGAAAIEEMRQMLLEAEAREFAERQRNALARKVALAALVEPWGADE